MSGSWTKIVVPEIKNLEEIMFEEVKDNFKRKQKNKDCILTLSTIKWRQDIGDEQLAKILQGDTSRCESDQHDSGNDESDTEDVENIDDKMYYEKFDSVLKDFDPIPLYNSRGKHDVTSNNKFTHICGSAVKTTSVLDKFMKKGTFDKINGIMAKGKEAVIFKATKKIESSDTVISKNYAVKVYKMRQPIIRWIYDYIIDEYKHIRKYGNPKSTYLARSKAEKEMLYLQRMKNAGIPCPEVIALKIHVLVLSVIGDDKPAPNLQQARIRDTDKMIIAYEQVVQYMKIIYDKCNFIHGNMSGENILWYNDTCYLIDLGQSVELHEEEAFHFLFNDCRNICNFFTTKFNLNVMTPEELFLDITGYNYLNRIDLVELQGIIATKHKSSMM